MDQWITISQHNSIIASLFCNLQCLQGEGSNNTRLTFPHNNLRGGMKTYFITVWVRGIHPCRCVCMENNMKLLLCLELKKTTFKWMKSTWVSLCVKCLAGLCTSLHLKEISAILNQPVGARNEVRHKQRRGNSGFGDISLWTKRGGKGAPRDVTKNSSWVNELSSFDFLCT